jgi:hypothetical protein
MSPSTYLRLHGDNNAPLQPDVRLTVYVDRQIITTSTNRVLNVPYMSTVINMATVRNLTLYLTILT